MKLTSGHESANRESELLPLEAGGVSADAFKSLFRHHPAGVAVITADAGDGPVGLTATSVFSVSAEPALLVFSVSDLSSSAPTIRSTETVVVHLISDDRIDIAKLCATSGIDRFADERIWSRLPTGEPVFHGAHAWIRGRVIKKIDAGASSIVIVHAIEAKTWDVAVGVDTHPLVYHDRGWYQLTSASAIVP